MRQRKKKRLSQRHRDNSKSINKNANAFLLQHTTTKEMKMSTITNVLKQKRYLVFYATLAATIATGLTSATKCHATQTGVERGRKLSEQKLTFNNLTAMPEGLESMNVLYKLLPALS